MFAASMLACLYSVGTGTKRLFMYRTVITYLSYPVLISPCSDNFFFNKLRIKLRINALIKMQTSKFTTGKLK